MAKEYRSPALAKSDPLLVERIKMSKSTLHTLTVEANLQQRSRAFIVRELLEVAAAGLRVKHAEAAASKAGSSGRASKKSASAAA